MIVDYDLFLAFPLSHSYVARLDQVPSGIRSVFIQNHPDYLQQVDHEGKVYLGKFLGQLVEFSSLDLIQQNIYSLLRCLVADYPYEQHPLVLLAISNPIEE